MESGRKDYTALFIPAHSPDLEQWLYSCSGSIKAEDMTQDDVGPDIGLVRDLSNNGSIYMFRDAKFASLDDTLPGGAMEIYARKARENGPSDKYTQYISLENGASDPSDFQECIVLEVERLPKVCLRILSHGVIPLSTCGLYLKSVLKESMLTLRID